MKANELAALLNGRQYGDEITDEEAEQAKKDGLVVVFGASDDLTEFRGAIEDEYSAYGGGTSFIDHNGLLPDREQVEDDDEALEQFFIRKRGRLVTIAALWCKEEPYSWTFATAIPHSTFDVMEDGDKYCRGIVFEMPKEPTPKKDSK